MATTKKTAKKTKKKTAEKAPSKTEAKTVTKKKAEIVPLRFGEKVPPLDKVDWVKGKAPSLEGTFTLVDCWATWCQPCAETIPMLSEWQKRYKGKLQVVGISAEPLEDVQAFIEEQGSAMNYTVGAASEATYQSYMKFEQYIPRAFLIDPAGRLLWIGHPAGMLAVVEGLLEGGLKVETAVKQGALLHELEKLTEAPDGESEDETVERLERMLEVAEKYRRADSSAVIAVQALLHASERLGRFEMFRTVVREVKPELYAADDALSLASELADRATASLRAYAEAFALADYAVANGQEDPSLLFRSSEFYTSLGDVPAALRSLEKLVALLPEDAEAKELLEAKRTLHSLTEARRARGPAEKKRSLKN